MSNRWWTITVVVFWLATLCWLVTTKILPSLLVGEPPTYRTIVDPSGPLPQPVAWRLQWNDEPVGRADSQWRRQEEGITELETTVSIDRLPLGDLVPSWLRHPGGEGSSQSPVIPLDVITVIQLDPISRLIGFRSQVSLGDGPPVVQVDGTSNDDVLRLVVRSGGLAQTTELPLPPQGLLGDIFSPPTNLPGLREGQRWTIPVYSPFAPPNRPLDVLVAVVERKSPILWNGRVVPTWLIVYRKDPGAGVGQSAAVKAREWVRTDGTVLKREIRILNSKLMFERMSPHPAVDDQEAARAQRS